MSYYEGSNWQAKKEDNKERLYKENKPKNLIETDRPFFIDTFRRLLNKYDKEEISMSKFVEELNIIACNWKNKV